MNNVLRFLLLFLITFGLKLGFTEHTDFYFVQITDTHWGDPANLERTSDAIKAINKLPFSIEFVIHTGDVTSNETDNPQLLNSGMAIMKTCKYPVYYIPGNNDIREGHFKKDSAAFTSYFGNFNRRIDKQKYSIILLYNLEITAKGSCIYEPLGVLDSLLKTKPSILPAFVFQHCPTTVDFYSNAIHPGWSAEKLMKFQNICENNNVKAVFTGHFHRDGFHMIGAIPLFIAPPISKAFGRQPSFRVYHYENGKIHYTSVYF
ncbi:MAG: hypothetical protein GX267_07780 [Fibrobacter sp.]|jgi:predicted phosphodiesterase|nr:hypothetical protein [Fibrobacter sp.]